MANFSNAIEHNWVVNSLAAANKRSVDLKPFEFAILDQNTAKTVAFGDTVGKDLLFVVGSPNNAQATDGQKVNRQYNPINTNTSFRSQEVGVIPKMRFLIPDKQDLTQVYYLGYNGLDKCESLAFECGKTYDFHINVKGQAVANIFGRHEMNEVVSVDTPCCDASCGCVNGVVDCSLVIDTLIDRFTSDIFWVNRFFKVEKVLSCSPAVTAPTQTNYTTYCLTVCDNGDSLDMSAVQKQYGAVTIDVKSRTAPYTTYQFTQLAAAAAPAIFTQQAVTLKDCTNCPVGYTAVAGGFAYVVEIDNTAADILPAAQLAAVQAVWATATFASKQNFSYGTSTYYVVSSAALIASTGDSRIVRDLGVTLPRCTQTTPVTTAWVSCGTSYKISRDLVLTKENESCQTNAEELAEIQAYYANYVDVVPGSLLLDAATNACVIRMDIKQYNNALLENGCDTFGFDGAKFDSLPSYKGFKWEVVPCVGWTVNGAGCPVPPVASTACCQCGIKFTTKTFEDIYNGCTFDINEFDLKDPVDLVVGAYKPDGSVFLCGTDTPPFRKMHNAKYRTLKGRDVIKQIIISRNDRKEVFWNLTSKEALIMLTREGINYGVKLDDYYFAVSITNNIARFENHPLSGVKETITLYIHESDSVLFETIRGQLSASFPEARIENL